MQLAAVTNGATALCVSQSQHIAGQKIAALSGYPKNETGYATAQRLEYPQCVITVWSLSHRDPLRLVTN